MGVLASIIPMVGRPRGEIVLPPFTVRFKANRAVSTSDFQVGLPITLTLVDDATHTYDVTIGQAEWNWLFGAEPYNTGLTEVIAANTSGVTNMSYMFYNCNLLTHIPLFDMSSVTDMVRMLFRCLNIERGALAIYRQVSEKLTAQWRYLNAFTDCGSNTPTGLAELQQIPMSWGGLA